jgi:hypothetical protein
MQGIEQVQIKLVSWLVDRMCLTRNKKHPEEMKIIIL